jgi:CheY-like chemotaxis protein/REP element-mobilizing transposase RayT
MAKNILVATSQPAFGELLRLSLEESGRYRVRLVQTGREALSSAEHILFSLAILDTTLDEPPFLYVAQGLRKHQPGVRLLVIPSHEGEAAADVVAVQPDGCISQPFYAPSLLETINSLTTEVDTPALAESKHPPKSVIATAPPGPAGTIQPILQDAALVTQHLEDFLKDSTAPGVILLRMREPWAAAGQLNQEALNEVANLLTRYTAANEGVDLARYVHLQSDGSEYLIYATPLIDTQVLAMVYQVTTPLTVIRAQAGRLARLLRQAVTETPPASPVQATAPAVETKAAQTAPPDEGTLMDEAETADAVLEAEAMRLADLLTELPEPDPQSQTKPEPGDWIKAEPIPTAEESGFVFPWELQETPAAKTPPPPAPAEVELVEAPLPPAPALPETPVPVAQPQPAAAPISEQSAPASAVPAQAVPPQAGPVIPIPAIPPEPAPPILSPMQAAPPLPATPRAEPAPPVQPVSPAATYPSQSVEMKMGQAAANATSASFAQTVAVPVPRPAFPTMPVQRNPEPAPIEQTRPVLSRTQPSYPPVDATMPTFSNLAYTCLLLPRLPFHNLGGYVGQRLAEWLPQLCMAYGWRLESLLIQAEYLQWTVQVAPSISPGNVVRLIRQQTSRRVFMQFPQLEVENPSGDFWASGYLIVSGSQLPSPHLVQDFIRQTRQRQGSIYS